MSALSTGSEQERRRFRRSCYTATFALAGFLDIALSCRILADLGFLRSVIWGLVGAAVYALAYLALSITSQFLGDDPEGDAAARVDHEAPSEDEDDNDAPGPWWSELGWHLLTWAIVAVSTVWLFVLFNVKSIVVIAGFAALTPRPSTAEFLAVVVVSGTIQLVAMNTIAVPAAKRRGVSL
ncbi:hypothetical protein GL325_08270 [Aeromicrobium sp. 636]|uniref:Uncharacterized protein n=1 Tax=Aeromicrobium senzhongii TaxID=2663859 RepID=A0A8I0JZT0_9ACTN|nr:MULTISPECIES: hypothetical protein [Aeromicrobium]MBC9226312.1 hypothetical protein [Aeromicrobium senzhongii]MCQ3998418.1 hypothetical protein [Aeromicrobium sp. 636]